MLRLARDDYARMRLAEHGLETIRARHVCDQRAEQLEGTVLEGTVEELARGAPPRARTVPAR